ncbi:MAG: PIN domain-containing protein [Nitrososphaerales archaeon]
MAKILCDTDFIIKIANDPLPKVDWVSFSKQNEITTIPLVVKELEGLKKSKDLQTVRRAKNALAVIQEGKKIKVFPTGDDKFHEADQELIELTSASTDTVLATMDGSLLSRLERIGLPYYTLSNNKLLEHPRKGATHLSLRKK